MDKIRRIPILKKQELIHQKILPDVASIRNQPSKAVDMSTGKTVMQMF